MSRFHEKYHRQNHHTNPSVTNPDSSHDPIASYGNPFQGDFILNGMLSAAKSFFVPAVLNTNPVTSAVAYVPIYYTTSGGASAVGYIQIYSTHP